MNARLILLALPLALAGCDQQAVRDFRLPWDKPAPAPVVAAPAAPAEPPKPSIPEPTGASPAQQPLEIAGERTKVATAEAQTANATRFTASGEGWSATVDGTTARVERAGGKPATVKVQRLVYAGGVEYAGTLNDALFSLDLRSAACGGQPLTATLKANGKKLAGCASPGSAAPAKAAAATAPTQKPQQKPAA